MANFVNLTIDGQKVRAREGQTILEAARNRPGIGKIPVLCDAKAVAPYGACRMCSVEISKGGNGHSRLVASCMYPVEEGLNVLTNSPRVIKLRKGIIELLLARCPNVETIKNMAAELGVTKPRFETEDNNCILCGLCVRVCSEVTGNKVMSLVNRGVDREVAAPFYDELPKKCIGCGDCMYICPTKAIRMGPNNKVILPRPRSKALAGVK